MDLEFNTVKAESLVPTLIKLVVQEILPTKQHKEEMSQLIRLLATFIKVEETQVFINLVPQELTKQDLPQVFIKAELVLINPEPRESTKVELPQVQETLETLEDQLFQEAQQLL